MTLAEEDIIVHSSFVERFKDDATLLGNQDPLGIKGLDTWYKLRWLMQNEPDTPARDMILAWNPEYITLEDAAAIWRDLRAEILGQRRKVAEDQLLYRHQLIYVTKRLAPYPKIMVGLNDC